MIGVSKFKRSNYQKWNIELDTFVWTIMTLNIIPVHIVHVSVLTIFTSSFSVASTSPTTCLLCLSTFYPHSITVVNDDDDG